MNKSNNFLQKIKNFNLPTCLRICAGTDGSVTFLLEIMTLHEVVVDTESQFIVKADAEKAAIFGIEVGDELNCRNVKLISNGIPYVYAKSYAPIDIMPKEMKEDLMNANIPIGKILRNYDMETRRDFLNVGILKQSCFGCESVIYRDYVIIHNKKIIMWINEKFPIDDRWNL